MNTNGPSSPKDPNKPNSPEKSSEGPFRKAGESVENKFKDTMQNIRKSEFFSYACCNREQTITYIVLALGIILLLTDFWFIGGLIVGGVVGYHFSMEVIDFLRNIRQIFEGPDRLRYIVLTGLLIGFLITSPGIVIGIILVALIKHFAIPSVARNMSNGSDKDYPDAKLK